MKINISQPYSFCQLGARSNQEDARYPNSDMPQNPLPFFVVCDGVGGLDKGEVASRTVCESFARSLSDFDWTGKFEAPHFEEALQQAYDALSKVVQKGTEEMATTMTFVGFHKGGATMAHIGDSRIYQIRPEVGIIYRSDDHSLVNALVRSGNITAEQVAGHPQSNFITRSMSYVETGKDYSPATLVHTIDIMEGDYFLLCTDGVSDTVSEEELISIFEKDVADEQKCRDLAKQCEDSSDNNTAIFVKISNIETEDDDINEELIEEGKTSSDTVAFRRQTDIAVEVGVKNKKSIGKKLSGLFKKIF